MIAPWAESEMKAYCGFSWRVATLRTAPSMLRRQPSRCSAPPMHDAHRFTSQTMASVGDDGGDRHPPAGLEHAGDLGEHGPLVRAQVDDAVADDHVDGGGLGRQVLDVALVEAHVGEPGLGRERAGLAELLLCHVYADDLAAGLHGERGHECVHPG